MLKYLLRICGYILCVFLQKFKVVVIQKYIVKQLIDKVEAGDFTYNYNQIEVMIKWFSHFMYRNEVKKKNYNLTKLENPDYSICWN